MFLDRLIKNEMDAFIGTYIDIDNEIALIKEEISKCKNPAKLRAWKSLLDFAEYTKKQELEENTQ